MAQVINTNSLSLLTQNNLNKSQSSLSSAIERLSSGLRINSAKDDAAGQAIANRFTANIKGLTQASRNANDGISVAQTTEGALNEINNNLQRVRELTVQATNGTNSDSDLSSIQAEITQRLEEIDRVSEQTQFNGVKVLAENNEMKIQVGANDGETITINLAKIDAKTLGLDGFNIDGAQKATGSDLISKFKATGTDNYQVKGDNYTVNVDSGAVKNEAGDDIYVSAADGSLTTSSDTKVTIDASKLAQQAVSLQAGKSIVYEGITFTNKSGANFDDKGNGVLTANVDGKDVEFTISSSTDATGTGAKLTTANEVYKNSAGQLTATKVENKAATLSDLDLNAAKKTGSTLVVNGATYNVSADGKTVTDATPGNDKVMYLSKSEGGSPILVNEDAAKSLQSTTNPLETIDKALAKVDNLRSDLGAVQNRFDSAITNLGNTVNNLSSARSRIEDADYATEVSNMSRAQILQQAGTSVLAQANQTTQNVLSLLR
ncbi:flagellin N-terminal helical domain-containing protein [Escherichia fergusonii]|uniref:flagellin N-terminal helical domain-containing protein n=1 Tax=Escherichia fergusonii TaxID=564 RepID=UPI0018198D20|nr:flagellin [Escherichia fergusonii]EFL4480384.1 flagellin FliC [Escherichia fergusonii]MBY7444726.1 flagellin FliC [Escherichia fergusonii]MBY7557062.1 flagellin FliC [Escherichia fergusonii]MCH5367151.1 flagellin FliC [Escherichia fergusonii]HCO5017092.1 flagellin FliC [Escherichia fergusonii]